MKTKVGLFWIPTKLVWCIQLCWWAMFIRKCS